MLASLLGKRIKRGGKQNFYLMRYNRHYRPPCETLPGRMNSPPKIMGVGKQSDLRTDSETDTQNKQGLSAIATERPLSTHPSVGCPGQSHHLTLWN